MELAKALGHHVHPTMLVVPFGLLGIGPALTLMCVAFGLLLVAGWLADGLIGRSGPGVDPRAGVEATAGLGGGPTRW